MDDLLTGADTPDQALTIFNQLRSLLEKGGFDLRKWRCSCPSVLESINPSLRERLPVQDLSEIQTSLYPKALGVEWDSAKDVMSTSLCLPTTYQSTKRGVLSDVARTFDVLSCTIIVMKMLYQRLWELKIAWDDPLPSHLVEQHVQWRNQLPLLASRSQSRCYFVKEAHRKSVQRHGFCDASQQAYAAVVYIRATYTDHTTTCVQRPRWPRLNN